MNFFKIALAVLFFFVIFIFTLVLFVGPISGDLARCYDQASIAFDETIKAAGEGRWDEERICRENKDTLIKLRGCTHQVQVMNSIPVHYIEGLTKTLRPKLLLYSELIKWHNEKCSEYPELIN